MKKTTLLLLAFIGLCSFQVNAQDTVTFLQEPDDGNWQTTTNWDGGVLPGTTDQALILYAGDLTLDQNRTIGNIKFQTNTARSFLDAGSTTLTLDTHFASNDRLIDNSTNRVITIHPSINFTDSGKIYVRNKAANFIFTGGTIDINSNTINIDNRSLNSSQYIQFNGPVEGDGIINVDDSQNAGATMGISLGADANFSTFTGTINAKNNPIVSSTTNAFGSALTLDGTASFEINVASTFTGSISRLATTAGAATVTFNANQSMGALTVDTQNLAIDFDNAATSVVFSEYTTSVTEGIVDLKNYVSGSLKIGNSGTSVNSTILETWTLDGATAAITQDTDGSIIFAECTEAVDVTSLAVSAETTTTIDLGWVNSACFDEVLVVAKSGSAVTAEPTGDGTTPTHTANAAFGTAGTDTNLIANEFAVYKGTANTVSVTGLTTNTDYHFEVFTRKGSDWSDGVVINEIPNTFTTDTDGTWELGTNWLGDVAPSTATDNVIINNTITINSDVTVNDLSRSTGSLTVEPGFSLTLNGTEAMGHQLYANSTATSFASLMLNGTITQHIGYNLYVNSNANGNDLISTPFAETLAKMLSFDTGDGTDQIFNNTAGGDATQLLFGEFDNENGVFLTSDSDNNFTSTIGTGYRAATISGSKIQFKGLPAAIANIDVSITHGAHGTYGQWNLIGNPYPTYLNFQEFFTTNTAQLEAGTNNALYMWDGSDYSIYNNTNTTATSLIAPGEGFFVKAKNDGTNIPGTVTGTVTFTPAMRKIATDGTLVAKSANNTNKALAKINLTTATKKYATDIYFIDNQTKGVDSGYDAGAFDESKDGIYTNLVEDNTGVALSIQALPYEGYNNVIVPVAIKSEANTELTISLDDASLTLPANTYVYLKDNVLNTTTLLNDTDYVFTPDTELSGAGRFFIEFSAKAVLATDEFAVNELLIYTNQASKSIIIKGVLKTDATAKVFDIQGREVLKQKLDNSSLSNVVNANALKTGIYMVQLEDKVQKVIIK